MPPPPPNAPLGEDAPGWQGSKDKMSKSDVERGHVKFQEEGILTNKDVERKRNEHDDISRHDHDIEHR